VSYQISITPAVHHELRALPAYVRSQAILLIDDLTTNPRPSRAKELRGKPDVYRIWLAGRWRIAYRAGDAQQVVHARDADERKCVV
jgi:mRNA-degrading endonuclease RelE of RelBE toxin-antitoxin system